jgi:hypothetical protein
MGCIWIVPRQGASCLARTDGNISFACVAPMSFKTSGSLECTGVSVIMCQKTVRSSALSGSVDQGAAAVCVFPRMTSGEGAIEGARACTIKGSS